LSLLPFAIFAAVVLAFGAMWWFSPDQRRRRLLSGTEVVSIASLRPGQRARITGRVAVQEGLRSPLSGTRCAAYQLHVEEHAGKNNWRSVATDDQCEPFAITDASGTCVVDPRGQHLLLTFDESANSGTFDDPTPAEAAVYERYGVKSTSILGLNRQLRIREATLAHDEAVTLLGLVDITEVGGVPTLSLVPDPEHGLVVSDHSDLT
jgi:hypothetical protein